MSNFKAGFARLDITPPIGTPLVGYYEKRVSDGILDPLTTTAVAVNDGERTALIIGVDVIGMDGSISGDIRARIAEACGVEYDRIFLSCTHTHLGHGMSNSYADGWRLPDVVDMTAQKIVGACKLAISDMKDAEMFVNEGYAPVPISFVRTYRMKDGSVATNPGIGNPEVDHPIGEADQRVALTCFKREGAPEIAIINFQTHCDTIAGKKISADYPYFVRTIFEELIPDTRCLYICGAQGNTAGGNVFFTDDMRNMIVKDKDGYGKNTRNIGRTIACTAASLYGVAKRAEPCPVEGAAIDVCLEHNKAKSAEELEESRRIKALYDAGKHGQIPVPFGHTGMTRTALIAEATKNVTLDALPDTKTVTVTGVRIGDFALVGFPGEPFTEIGTRVRDASDYKMTFISCCANGYEGYYPSRTIMEAGSYGYEYRTAKYKIGTDDKLVDAGVELLGKLKEEK